MKSSEPIYKSNFMLFGYSFSLVLFITYLLIEYFILLNSSEAILDKYRIFQIIIISIIYLALLWLLVSMEIRYYYIYDDRVEIHHPLYCRNHRWKTIENQDIIKVEYSPGSRGDGPKIFILKKERRGLSWLKRSGFEVKKIEDKKTVLNHFYKLNIPIKIYSEAKEDLDLIDK